MSIWLGNQRLDGSAKDMLSYGNISNCITEIPQDIKLELNNGTLTLKAGSKVYVPNGVGIFDEVVIQSDVSVNLGTGNTQFIVYDRINNTLYSWVVGVCSSGGSQPSSQYFCWYDTTNNLVKNSSNYGTTINYSSLPIAIINSTATATNQVFNGFGYIGSTKFVLPHVKGLLPDGFNNDGSLKNIEFTVESVLTTTGASTDTVVGFFGENSISNHVATTYGYNPELNLIVRLSDGVPYREITGVNRIPFTNPYHQTGGKIDFCTFRKSFQAVDYSATEYIAHQAMPSNRYMGLTLGTSGSSYTAPADGIVQIVISEPSSYAEIATDQQSMSTTVSVAGGWARAFLPVKKGQSFNVYYGGSNFTLRVFRFIYAEGAQ